MEMFLMLLGEIGWIYDAQIPRRDLVLWPAYWGRGTPSWVASSTVPGGGAWAGLNAPLSRCHRKSKLIATAFTRRRTSSSFPQPFIPLVLRLDSTFCFIACNLDSAISPGNSHVRVVTFSECP
ncbi:hypothetical protein HID58_072479 [Brassica napus]|uniref:BnaC06g26810D protein n=2 Tax=Brassica napus TaxID=3708 RepID=A0A078GW83_BRANA|nr:hypothetical protein HID58_072479 [Brassica napus]CAF2062444.1 unnamed protein product [Brassica napus]CDY28893.1 BnaC06g26810D [Brassica napus]